MKNIWNDYKTRSLILSLFFMISLFVILMSASFYGDKKYYYEKGYAEGIGIYKFGIKGNELDWAKSRCIERSVNMKDPDSFRDGCFDSVTKMIEGV